MSQDEEMLRRLVLQLQILEGSANALQTRISYINAAITEMQIANQTLNGLMDEKSEVQVLVPIGGGSYLKARIEDTNTIIVGIGADISLEMEYNDAVTNINERLNEMEKAQNSIEQQLGQIMAQLDTHQNMAERLSAEIQQGVQGSI